MTSKTLWPQLVACPGDFLSIRWFPRKLQASIRHDLMVAENSLAETHVHLVLGALVTSDTALEVQDANLIYYLPTAWGGEKAHKSVLGWSFWMWAFIYLQSCRVSLQEVAGTAIPDWTDKSLPFTQTAFIVSNSFVFSLGEEECHIVRFLPLFSRWGGSDVVALNQPVNHIRDRVGKSSVQGAIPMACLFQAPRNPSLGLSVGMVCVHTVVKKKTKRSHTWELSLGYKGLQGNGCFWLLSLLLIRSKGTKRLLEYFSFILHSFIGNI